MKRYTTPGAVIVAATILAGIRAVGADMKYGRNLNPGNRKGDIDRE